MSSWLENLGLYLGFHGTEVQGRGRMGPVETRPGEVSETAHFLLESNGPRGF